MAREKLTAKRVEHITTEKTQEDVWDLLTPGLCLRVGKGGSKTWYVRYRFGSTHRRHKLGVYDRLDLAGAREAAKEALAKADRGEDPAAEREQAKSRDTTFGALAREVLDAKTPNPGEEPKRGELRQRTQDEYERLLRTELAVWKDRPAASITRRDVKLLHEAICKRGTPVLANRVLALVKAIFNAGLDREFPTLEANPATRLKPCEENGRKHYLSRDEMGRLWRALDGETPIGRSVMRMALLTAARINNVLGMRWKDVDDADVWRIPEADFKGRREHWVPLSAEALAVLDEMRPISGKGEYVFPGRSDGATPHRNSATTLIERLREDAELPGFRAHDFRRCFRTWATRPEAPADPRDPAGLGVLPHVADAVLGHKDASLGTERYTGEPERFLLAEKREALAKWGAFVRKAAEKRA